MSVPVSGLPGRASFARLVRPDVSMMVLVFETPHTLPGSASVLLRGLRQHVLGPTAGWASRSSRESVPGFASAVRALRAPDHAVVERSIVGRRRLYAVWARVHHPRRLPDAERFVRSLRPDPADAPAPLAGDGTGPSWTQVYLEPDGFAVRMPRLSRDAIASERLLERPVSARSLEARDGETLYRVRVLHFDHGAPPLRELAAALAPDATATSHPVRGYAGRDLVRPDGSRARILHAGSRVYLLEIVPGSVLDPSRASAFFDSFRLL